MSTGFWLIVPQNKIDKIRVMTYNSHKNKDEKEEYLRSLFQQKVGTIRTQR